MTTPRSPNKLLARASHLVYEFPNRLMVGWEAKELEPDKYEIIRPPLQPGGERTRRIIELYQPMDTIEDEVIPTRDESGCLLIGSRSVIIGENLAHEWHARARKGRRGEYLVFHGRRQVGNFKLGGTYQDKPISLIQPHLLQFGDLIVPVAPKKREITILIQDVDVGPGKLAFINVIEPGNTANRKDGAASGTRPYYVRPVHAGEPGRFYETFEGTQVMTAVFWGSKTSNKVAAEFRTPHDALLESKLEEKTKALSLEALDVGLDPEDYQDYVEANQLLQEVRARWKKCDMGMMSGDGRELFIPLDELPASNQRYSRSPTP
ncbi:hypothetical protein ACYPKM_03080 [Pseudomonas aeruginosa]